MWLPGYDDRWLGAHNLSCFRPEEDFGQTVSIAGSFFDLEIGCHCSELSVEASLNPPAARDKPKSFRSPPTVRTATKTSSPRVEGRPGRAALSITVAAFETQYNHPMADRIACSCVTCPKCGTWVVVSPQTKLARNQEKSRASCPAADCGKEFEFSSDDTRVFELPLSLFERRHFFRSELR
jgi:hypothetical protein